MAIIIDGKKTAGIMREEIRQRTADFQRENGFLPGLTVIIVGQDPASQVYVRNKKKDSEEVGFNSEVIELPENTSQDELLGLIKQLNERRDVHGILVQLPLPKHLDSEIVIGAIDPDKDVDAFSYVNVGKITVGNHSFLPCTPAGVMELLKRYDISVAGKNCVVVGRSNIVGKPMANLMMQKSIPGDATVTVCHSHTKNIAEECKQADIIIAALGQPNFLKAEMVKEGAVVIDVGTTRIPDATKKSGFRLCGDVDFENVAPKCSFITPVPGGVGPMTIVSLMKNTLLAGKREIYK
jgi:methylenetetrahydrofolate dehydrogenase (NADP+)/methenyltetrahydrofolate cyclohydrolase